MGQEGIAFGPFRLVRRLGAGGMAETFEAIRIGPEGFEQRVCLKRVLPAFRDDPEIVRQLEREARLASGLRHGNVVAVLDYGAIEGTPYIALELVDGVDLRALLASATAEPLTRDLVVLIAIDLAEALDHAHRATSEDAPEGIVHRDVSPSNVLLDVSGGVRLADFGIAKAMKQAAATVSGTVRGKIPYMAPEHIRGERVDGRVDLFSLGVVLYEAIAGERPFDGSHDVETMTRVLAASRTPLGERAPSADPALVAIVERLLAPKPEDRFPDASALASALGALAPAPAARRTLAARVRALRDERTTRERRELAEATTAPGAPKIPAPPEEAPVAAAPRARARFGRVFVPALAIGLSLLAISAWIGRSREPRAETTAPEEAPREPAVATTPPAAPPAPAAPPLEALDVNEPPPDAAAAVEEGVLHVAVAPWGQVWIDGKFMGRAPVVTRLGAGAHLVAAGVDRPTVRRRVQVQPRRTQRVVLDVDDR